MADRLASRVENFDGDRRADILWRHATGPDVYLYRMDGKQILEYGYVGAVSQEWTVAGIADFDGDGKADILWRHATRPDVYVYLMNGKQILDYGYVGAVSQEWSVAGVADFDGDGKADILWRHATLPDVDLYRMNGKQVLDAFVEHYNGHRPHRALALTPPRPTRPPVAPATEWGEVRVQRRDRLGGVVHEYVLAA